MKIGLTTFAAFAFVLNAATLRADGGDTSLIHACVAKDGVMRVVSATTACKNNETALHWNIMGPPGAQGPQGVQGPQGLPGTTGQLSHFNVDDPGLILPGHREIVDVLNYDVPASANSFHVISFGGNFANPGNPCIGQAALYIDDNFKVDGLATVAAGGTGTTGYGFASVASHWVINDGQAHRISLRAQQIDCAPNTLQLGRPYLSVTTLNR